MPALYYHFASKDELLRNVTEPLLTAGDSFLARLARLPRGGFARRALEGYYDLIVDHFPIYRLVSTDRRCAATPRSVAGRRTRRRSSSTSSPGRAVAVTASYGPPPPPARCAVRCGWRASTPNVTAS